MDKRDQIIEAAIELFAAQGFESTSINAICKATGVSKGLVFHHFSNKNELLREVFKRMAHLINEVEHSIDVTLPAKDRLAQMLELIFTSMADDRHRLFYQLNYQVVTHPTIRAVLHDLIDAQTDLMRKSLEVIFDQVPELDSKVQSRMLIAEIDGISMHYVLFRDEFPLAKIKPQFIEKHLAQISFYQGK